VSSSSSGPGDAEPGEDGAEVLDDLTTSGVSPEFRARAGEALRASFARLSPQGSDEWNFMGAFTHLGDRYGPYQPGASDLADLLRAKGGGATKRGGRRGRLLGSSPPAADEETSELDDAMTNVVEAFRFLHARVSTLEARLRTEDVPLDGAAWLAPARELDGWVDPITALVLGRAPAGEVLHADCGEGALVRALTAAGAPAYGIEPRGVVALRALEVGSAVTISEVAEHMAQRAGDDGSLGGVVLSGVVDRLPLHAIVPLLADCRRALASGAPIVIVSEPLATAGTGTITSQDMVDRAALHLETWDLLLDRSGFVDVTPLPAGTGGDERFGISASTPAT
jgi:hypothetical protein